MLLASSSLCFSSFALRPQFLTIGARMKEDVVSLSLQSLSCSAIALLRSKLLGLQSRKLIGLRHSAAPLFALLRCFVPGLRSWPLEQLVTKVEPRARLVPRSSQARSSGTRSYALQAKLRNIIISERGWWRWRREEVIVATLLSCTFLRKAYGPLDREC